jgi:hypothetical protein
MNRYKLHSFKRPPLPAGLKVGSRVKFSAKGLRSPMVHPIPYLGNITNIDEERATVRWDGYTQDIIYTLDYLVEEV